MPGEGPSKQLSPASPQRARLVRDFGVPEGDLIPQPVEMASATHVVAGGVLGADVRQGDLRDGGSVTVTLSVDAAALLLAGSGTVTVWPGDIAVTVSWAVPVVPAADPSALPASVPPVSVSVP